MYITFIWHYLKYGCQVVHVYLAGGRGALEGVRRTHNKNILEPTHLACLSPPQISNPCYPPRVRSSWCNISPFQAKQRSALAFPLPFSYRKLPTGPNRATLLQRLARKPGNRDTDRIIISPPSWSSRLALSLWRPCLTPLCGCGRYQFLSFWLDAQLPEVKGKLLRLLHSNLLNALRFQKFKTLGWDASPKESKRNLPTSASEVLTVIGEAWCFPISAAQSTEDPEQSWDKNTNGINSATLLSKKQG